MTMKRVEGKRTWLYWKYLRGIWKGRKSEARKVFLSGERDSVEKELLMQTGGPGLNPQILCEKAVCDSTDLWFQRCRGRHAKMSRSSWLASLPESGSLAPRKREETPSPKQGLTVPKAQLWPPHACTYMCTWIYMNTHTHTHARRGVFRDSSSWPAVLLLWRWLTAK